ncbi:MAG: ATP-binding protein [Terrisporobacter othiniensis]|uniref:sensor histidine kinase n=1 Tax=Terrisporobacter othiniensis TaxID=1577792 RepID=UPI000B042828|nr:ATP-binding protein [Terrisporobacter othiniensis]MDU6984448.1 ATP-binding protein [Terrisporobacter othiniensis]
MDSIMGDKLIVQKEKNLFIKIISGIVILSVILIARIFIKLSLVNNDMELIIVFMETFGLIFSILACTSFVISYKRIKNDSIFIISLMYLTLTISVAFQYMNYFNTFYNKFEDYNYDTITSWVLKSFLIIIALLPENKIKSFITNNKTKSIVFIFCYMLFTSLICSTFGLYNNERLFLFINSFLIIIYFVASIVFFAIGFKENEYLYFVISSSMFILTIKTIYIIMNINISKLYQLIIMSSLGYLVLLIIISGSFIELLLYVNRVKRLNKKLKVFYDLSDNNKHTSLLICDNEGNVVYANEKFKNHDSPSQFKFDKNYNEVLKAPYRRFRPTSEIDKIKSDLYKYGQWRGVLKSANEDLYIDYSVQLINPMDKNSLISVSYMDISDIINKELELERLKVYNREQTEFISNLSHELRTPIHIFYSTVQLLDKFCIQNESSFANVYKKYTKSLHLNCKRMLRLVNNVIDISKMETGILKGDFQYYNLISIIEDVTLSVKNYAEQKSINIHFDTSCEEFISKCDCNMIERVVLNLLSNAIKFTDENKNIYVNVFGHDDYIDIHIEDEGKGISKNDIEHIFKRFMQCDKSLTRKSEGSGIGLSIVKSIIDLHEGHISVESKIGVGTIFKIILPQIGDNPDECNIFDINDYNTELELSDIYEVLV